jgi:hypothetical protein
MQLIQGLVFNPKNYLSYVKVCFKIIIIIIVLQYPKCGIHIEAGENTGDTFF